jgi:hypothetical protein
MVEWSHNETVSDQLFKIIGMLWLIPTLGARIKSCGAAAAELGGRLIVERSRMQDRPRPEARRIPRRTGDPTRSPHRILNNA